MFDICRSALAAPSLLNAVLIDSSVTKSCLSGWQERNDLKTRFARNTDNVPRKYSINSTNIIRLSRYLVNATNKASICGFVNSIPIYSLNTSWISSIDARGSVSWFNVKNFFVNILIVEPYKPGGEVFAHAVRISFLKRSKIRNSFTVGGLPGFSKVPNCLKVPLWISILYINYE